MTHWAYLCFLPLPEFIVFSDLGLDLILECIPRPFENSEFRTSLRSRTLSCQQLLALQFMPLLIHEQYVLILPRLLMIRSEHVSPGLNTQEMWASACPCSTPFSSSSSLLSRTEASKAVGMLKGDPGSHTGQLRAGTRGGTGWGCDLEFHSSRNCPIDLPTGRFDGGIFSTCPSACHVEKKLSRTTLDYMKTTMVTLLNVYPHGRWARHCRNPSGLHKALQIQYLQHCLHALAPSTHR